MCLRLNATDSANITLFQGRIRNTVWSEIVLPEELLFLTVCVLSVFGVHELCCQSSHLLFEGAFESDCQNGNMNQAARSSFQERNINACLLT